MFKLNNMSACVKSSQSPRVLVNAESRRLKKLNRSAVEADVAEVPQVKDKSSLSEKIEVSLLSLQNEEHDFIPDELLTSLTSTASTQGRLDLPKLSRTPRYPKVCAIRAPDAVWHHEIGRKKYHYFLDHPTSVNGAGRDISFLCDALVSQKHRITLPPMSDTNSPPTADTKTVKTLIPSEYHVVRKKGVKALQCIDDKFTVLLEDEDHRLKVFPSIIFKLLISPLKCLVAIEFQGCQIPQEKQATNSLERSPIEADWLNTQDRATSKLLHRRPSGRLEAVQLMRIMDDMLDKAGVNQEFEELTGFSQMQGLLELVQVEQNIYNIVFHELIRQVSVECAERGQLLAKLRQRYVALLDRIPRQLMGLHAETLAQRALDRRLTEQIVCFKQSIAQLHEAAQFFSCEQHRFLKALKVKGEFGDGCVARNRPQTCIQIPRFSCVNRELNQIKEHDDQTSKQAGRAQEELSKALEQSQHNSDIVGEYHDLYEMQRQRLEGQVTTLIEERDLWSKVTYSLALKVIKLKKLQLVSRLHVSEQMWNETAEHFAFFIATQDSEDLNYIMRLTDQYKEQLGDFMEMLRNSERQQCESIRSIQNDIAKWQRICKTHRSPDVQLEKTTEEEFYNDLKQWSKVLIAQRERYGGQDLLSGQETLIRLAQLQESWMEVFLQLFRRHPTPDGEPPQGQAVMMELCHLVTEHHEQLNTRITGESGIHKLLTFLGRGIDFWANKLESLIGRFEALSHTDWLKLESALDSWITLSEEALLNVTSSQPEREKIKEKPHIKIETEDVFNTLRQFLSSQNNFFEYGNLSLCEEVRSMHMLRTRWMVDLLLLMVPDHNDDGQPSPNPRLNVDGDASHHKLKEDARNLSQTLNYISKSITCSCQAIVEELIQKNMSQDEAESELKQLSKLQCECSEWVEVSQILLSDLTLSSAELQLTGNSDLQPITVLPDQDSLADEHTESEMQAPAKTLKVTTDTKREYGFKAPEQEPGIDEVTGRDLRGSVLKLIGHDGHIIEQTLGKESVHLTGTRDVVLRPHSENALQAYGALSTVQVLQQELLNVEARAIRAEERAMEAEEALQAALEKIYELERQLPQSTSPETKASKNPALAVATSETTPEPKVGIPKPSTSPKLSKSKKKR